MLTPQQIMQLMEKVRAEFICLRCGSCCFNFSFCFPSGEEKRGGEYCRHLKQRRLEGEEWQPASCLIHENQDEYPWECRDFFAGQRVCPIGAGIWLHELKKHPGSRLPAEIEKHIHRFQQTYGRRCP